MFAVQEAAAQATNQISKVMITAGFTLALVAVTQAVAILALS